MVWLDGENTVSSCRAGTECGGDDSPCFVDVAFGACLLFGCLPVRCVSRYYFLGFGKGKEESFPLLACFVVVALWGIGGVYRRFGSRVVSLTALIAPYSAYGRIISNLLTPLYQWGNNVLALWAERVDSYAFYSVDVWMKGLSTFVVAVGTVIVLLFWHGVEEELIAIPFVRWVQYWDSYLDILILNRLLIRLNVMVADFVLVIASLPALIPKHMRLIIPVVLLVWIV